MVRRISLAPKLDSASAAALRGEILSAEQDDLIFDASSVEQFGALSLELLISTSVLWRKAGRSVSLENVSSQMADDLGRYGLTAETVMEFAA